MNIRTICLGILTFGDATGYEIKKKLEDGFFSHFLEGSYGSIYPALTKLTEEGLVSFTTHAQDGRPDKKVYSLTTAGRLALADALGDAPGDDRFRSPFLFYMLFCDLMEPGRVARLIDQQIAFYENQIKAIDEQDIAANNKADFIRGLGETVCRATIDYLRENRHLVEGQALTRRPAASPEANPAD